MTRVNKHKRRAAAKPEQAIPPHIAYEFEKFALQAAAVGHKRWSAKNILEMLRWQTAVEQGVGQYKINNNWAPQLARWLLDRRPELPPGFFETRRLRRKRDA